MQSKYNILMPGENDNTSEYFGPHKDQKYILNEQDIKRDHRSLMSKNLDNGSHAKDGLPGYTP